MVMKTAEATEQVPTEVTEQGVDESVVEAAVAAAAVDDGESNDGAQDADGAVDGGGDTEPDSIEALAERYPWLNDKLSEKVTAERNAAVQSHTDKQKREAGNRDNVKRSIKFFLERSGIDPKTIPEDRLALLADANRAFESLQLAQDFPAAVLGHYDVPIEVREAAIEARESGADGQPDLDGYMRTLIDGTVSAELGRRKLDDVPEGSPLRNEIEAYATSKASGEARAAGVASSGGKPSRPNLSGGSQATNASEHDKSTRLGLTRAFNDGDFGNPDDPKAQDAYREAYAKLTS